MTESDFLQNLFVAKRRLEVEGFSHTARAVSELLVAAQDEADRKRGDNSTMQAA